jgi:hypothetical protein
MQVKIWFESEVWGHMWAMEGTLLGMVDGMIRMISKESGSTILVSLTEKDFRKVEIFA